MQLLGKAPLIEHTHETGRRVRSADLSPFGGPAVFLGPIEQKITTGSVDRGVLRLVLPSLDVFQLAPGDPPPTIGGKGVGSTAFVKWLPIAAGVAAFLWLRQLKMRR